MGMFSRMTDIVHANINAMLDKAEDPQKLIRLMVQEMEEALAHARCVSAQYIAQKKQLNRSADSLNRSAQRWQEKAQRAVEKGNDSLARAALKEKQSQTRQFEILQEEIAQIDSQLDKLTDDIEQLGHKLTEARQKARMLSQREHTVAAQLELRNQAQQESVQRAMGKFEAYQQKVDQLEAQVEAYDLGSGSASLEAQFVELEQDESIEEELARMKKSRAA